MLNTERFADTLTLAAGFNAGSDAVTVSPTGDISGHVRADAAAYTLYEVTFDMGTATSANAIYRMLG